MASGNVGYMGSDELPQQRYRLLVEQLLAEEGGESVHGAIARTAERLNIRAAYVSKMRNEGRGGGSDVIKRACDSLGISADFFYRDLPAEPHYRDFLSPAQRQIPGTLESFLQSWPRARDLPDVAKQRLRTDLADLAARGGFTAKKASDWETIAGWALDHFASDIHERKTRQ